MSNENSVQTENNPASFPFDIQVSLYDTTPERYRFDQARVRVGRAADADLHLGHAAVARRQLTIERILPPVGPPRFRIVPEAGANPLLVNGVAAVEGALAFDDVVALGELRLVLRRPLPERRGLSPMRLGIAGIGGAAALLAVATLVVGAPARARSPLANERLFAHLPVVTCEEPRLCAMRARTAFAHGQTYAKQGASVAGNWYRAAVELYRAAEFQRLAGSPVAGLEDVRAQLAAASTIAESHFNDLQFRLARDLDAGDPQALRRTIDGLEAMVPDEEHPIRVKLAEYLRTHPLPKKGLE